MVISHRWSLNTGGRLSRFDCSCILVSRDQDMYSHMYNVLFFLYTHYKVHSLK